MKATQLTLFFLALLAGTLVSLKIIYRNQPKLPLPKAQNNLTSPSPNLSLEIKFKDIEINNQKFRVEIADTSSTIIKGLSDRDQIGSDGMLFIFSTKSGSAFGGSNPSSQPFWMKDMRFSIDLIWIKDNQVIGFEKSMSVPAPNTPNQDLTLYPPPSAITAVLELPSGSIEKINIKIGDKIDTK